YFLSATFFFSSFMNYVLAKWIVKSPAGSEAFNAELGRMTLLSYPMIAIPSMLMMMAIFYYLWRTIHGLTGLGLEEIVASNTHDEPTGKQPCSRPTPRCEGAVCSDSGRRDSWKVTPTLSRWPVQPARRVPRPARHASHAGRCRRPARTFHNPAPTMPVVSQALDTARRRLQPPVAFSPAGPWHWPAERFPVRSRTSCNAAVHCSDTAPKPELRHARSAEPAAAAPWPG